MTDPDEPAVPPLHRLAQRVRRQLHRFTTACKLGFELYRTTLRAFFFPDTFQLYTGTLVRGLFSLYYIPFLAIIFAVTHSALQRVVWVLIIPIAQEMERNPYNYSYWATFLYGVSSIFVRIIPFAALGLSVLTAGYKVQHCVGEAMLDAFVRHEGEDYPLLHARLRFMRENRPREVVFLIVLSLALAAAVVLLHTNAFVTWTMSGERSALMLSAWVIIVVEVCFVAVTAVVGAPKEIMEEQWTSLVSPIRRALTAPASTEVSALAMPAFAMAPRAPSSSSRPSSSGPTSPHTPGDSATSRPRRRREPYWRPLLQQSMAGAPASSSSPLADNRTSGASSPKRLPFSESNSSGGGLVGNLSTTSSAAATMPYTSTNHHQDIQAWRRHSTSDATSALHPHAPLRPEVEAVASGAGRDISLQTSLASSSCNDDDAFFRQRGRDRGGESRSNSSGSGADDDDDDDGIEGDEETFLNYFQEDWWRENIHKMRYIAVVMVSVVSVVTAVQRGLVNGLTIGVLLVMCLNLPHLVGYGTLAVCAAVIRTYRSFAWLSLHDDAFWPFVVLVSPYQVPLLYAIYFFRHHPLTMLLLLCAAALLLARGIDLVREFDVTEKGSVHWRNRHTGELLTPSLASLLEMAYAGAHQKPDLVSLDLVIDIQRMRIYDLASKVELAISRTQVFPYGAARRFLRSWDFYSFVIPRMLSLQSPGYFTGSKFRVMRVVLRILMVLLALSVSVITMGILLQAAFPNLRPLPVRVQAAQGGHALIFDHVVVRMHLQARQRSGVLGLEPVVDLHGGTPTVAVGFMDDVVSVADPAVAGGDDHAAALVGTEKNSSQVMLKLSNVTSPAGVDFYPQLCIRDYAGTSVWELALLALAPYLYNMDELTTMLRFMNDHLGSDWELRPRHGRSCRPGSDSSHRPTGWTGYFEVHSASRNTSVIALRGTDLFSFTDFLIDMNLFFEPVLFQVLANTIPGARLLPKELVADAIHATSLPETLVAENEEPLASWAELQQSYNHSLRRCRPNNYMRNFFADVENHISYIGSRPDRPKHVIVTGHSMGGAVASIVASRMGVQAVAFSAPGVLSARRKFGLELLALHQRVVTVASSNDIVPQMGEHGGEVQHVECLAERRELCHAMEFMVGTLWRSCSSVRQRFTDMDDVI